MNTIRQRMLVPVAALVFFCTSVRSEQPQRASRPTQEDRIKKLEERADVSEKAASNAAMEKDSFLICERGIHHADTKKI